MFQARPISLKVDVWDRIDAYLNDFAAQNPGFMPNRGAFIEEAVVAYLDLKEGGGASEETTDDEFSMDEELSDDGESMSDDEDSSSDDDLSADEDASDDDASDDEDMSDDEDDDNEEEEDDD
jgi:hypothetical protein